MKCDICQGNGNFNEPIIFICESCHDNKFAKSVALLKHQWVMGGGFRRFLNTEFERDYTSIKSAAKIMLKEVK